MKKKLVLLLSLMIMIFLSGCGLKQKGQIVNIVGSSALQPLVEAAGEQYNQEFPDVYINVQGGGSGTGLAQIQAGAVDVGNSDLFAQEKSGIDASKIVDHQVAVVGITPIVNPDITVDSLTLSQLRDIFLGKIKNWSEVGGPNQKIVLLNRAQGSGTRVAFEQLVLENQQPKTAQEQDSNGMVRKIISSTPGAISYVAFSYVDSSIKTLNINGKKPTQKNVTTNDWPLWSYEHMYTTKKPNQQTKDFIKYMQTDEVQDNVINKMGYIAIKDMKVKRSLTGKVSQIN